MADTAELIRLCVSGNASNALTEAEYRDTHARLCGKYEQTELRLRELSQQRKEMQEKQWLKMNCMILLLKSSCVDLKNRQQK